MGAIVWRDSAFLSRKGLGVIIGKLWSNNVLKIYASLLEKQHLDARFSNNGSITELFIMLY